MKFDKDNQKRKKIYLNHENWRRVAVKNIGSSYVIVEWEFCLGDILIKIALVLLMCHKEKPSLFFCQGKHLFWISDLRLVLVFDPKQL